MRIRTTKEVDRFPHFICPPNATGMVAYIGDDGAIWVRMDKTIEGAEEWDNEVCWGPIHHDDPIKGFWDDVELI